VKAGWGSIGVLEDFFGGVVGRDITSTAVASLPDEHFAVQPRLPLLSTYLGHVDPSSTYWYLSARPELLAAAAQQLQTHLGMLP